MKPRTAQEIILHLVKKEHKRLLILAAKRKVETDECCNVGSEMMAIHRETIAIAKSGCHPSKLTKRINALKKRDARARIVMDRSICELQDREMEAEFEAANLAQEISMIEYRINQRA